ncbi:hypothetical protein D3C79_879260 [compost metagenome]
MMTIHCGSRAIMSSQLASGQLLGMSSKMFVAPAASRMACGMPKRPAVMGIFSPLSKTKTRGTSVLPCISRANCSRACCSAAIRSFACCCTPKMRATFSRSCSTSCRATGLCGPTRMQDSDST